MIVEKLKPWVTSFSEVISHQYKHGDQVWVGGEVTEIFSIPNVQELIPESEKGEPMLDAVYLTLDDGVGINKVMVPRIAFQKYQEIFGLEVGKIVLAEGKVYQLEMKEKHPKTGVETIFDRHPEGGTRIVCWKIIPLPETTTE